MATDSLGRVDVKGVAVGTALLIAWFAILPDKSAFPLDDAYIHLSYARNLLLHGEFAFNQGEPSYGSSSLSWPMLLAGALALPVPIAITASLFLLGVHGAFTLNVRRLMPKNNTAVLLLVACLSANAFVLWHVHSGMETVLFTAMAFFAIRLAVARPRTTALWVLLGVALLTRINALVLVGVLIGADQILLRGKAWTERARGLLFYVSSGVPYLVTTLLFKLPLQPTTIEGKKLTYVNMIGGEHYVALLTEGFARFLPELVLFACLCGLGAVVVVSSKRRGLAQGGTVPTRLPIPLLLFWLWALADSLTYVVAFRSEVLQQFRYHYPLILASTVGGIFVLSALPASRIKTALVLVACALSGKSFVVWRRVLEGGIEHMRRAHLPAAELVARTIPGDRAVASFDIGALKYSNPYRPIVDLGGLTRSEIHSYLKKKEVAPFLFAKNVDFLLIPKQPYSDFTTGLFKSEYSRAHRTPMRTIATFRAPAYPHPAFSQSLQVDVVSIEKRAADCTAHACLAKSFEIESTESAKTAVPLGMLRRWSFMTGRVEPEILYAFHGVTVPPVLELYLEWRVGSRYPAPYAIQVVGADGKPRFTVHKAPYHRQLVSPDPSKVYQEHHIWPLPDIEPGAFSVRLLLDTVVTIDSFEVRWGDR